MSSKPFSSVLDLAPANLNAYERLSAMQELALANGWRWPSIPPVLAKTQEELDELKEAFTENDRQHIVEELGDLLFMATLLCHYAEVDPQEAIAAVTRKFRGRYGYVEKRAHETGRNLKDVPHEEERRWYAEYKAQERKAG